MLLGRRAPRALYPEVHGLTHQEENMGRKSQAEMNAQLESAGQRQPGETPEDQAIRQRLAINDMLDSARAQKKRRERNAALVLGFLGFLGFLAAVAAAGVVAWFYLS